VFWSRRVGETSIQCDRANDGGAITPRPDECVATQPPQEHDARIGEEALYPD